MIFHGVFQVIFSCSTSGVHITKGSTSKKQAKDKDRISALPDALLCHILSFLPTKYAVRSTLLSKRWKNKWTSITNLDFEGGRDFCTDEKGCHGSRHFMNFVGRYLDLFRIDAWICTAVMRNVVELDVGIFRIAGTTFQIPRSLFICKTLKVLRVWSKNVSYDPPTTGCFPSLKFLRVTAFLFSICPRLEHLSIYGTSRVDVDYTFKLESLDIKQAATSTYCLKNSRSLVSASISFNYHCTRERCLFSNGAISLLAGISSVKHLSVDPIPAYARDLPAFNNLRQLKLVLYDFNDWDMLAVFLDRAPFLEDLALVDETKYTKKRPKLQWNQPPNVPTCLLSHLKTVSLKGLEGRRVDTEVAKYLLNNGCLLSKLTIYAGRSVCYQKEELYKKLLKFHRTSRTCQVEFI
ncbi:unnamed protein product [Malus baccata var. baccata]